MSEGNSKKFISYVVPSVMAFALSGVYTIVDGFFIGHSMGDAGLAAITIGFPVCALIQSIGTGIGLSGAIRFTILGAQNEMRRQEECFSGVSVLMMLASLVLTGLLYVTAGPAMSLMGAKGELYLMAVEYVKVIAVGTVCQLLATGFVPFIRNMGGARFAMFAMILGFVTNIVLDYVFVWVMELGMAGAAWATVIGQLMTLIAAVVFFIRKKYPVTFSGFSEMRNLWIRVLKVSVSPFGLTFSPTLTLLFMNRFLFTYGNDQSVAVFGTIDYVLCIIYLLLQGVGDGSQPLISDSYGAGEYRDVRAIRLMAYKLASGISVFFMIVVFLTRTKLGPLFGASDAANVEVIYYIPWFLATLLCLSFSRITTTYFYATEKTGFSYILVYGESLLTLLMLCLLPILVPVMMPECDALTGVWLAMPTAQVLNFILALVLKKHADRELLKGE